MAIQEQHAPAVTTADSVVGLTTAAAQAALRTYGPNEPAPPRRFGLIIQLLPQLINPLVLILLGASVVAATLGEVVNAVIIIVMVTLSLLINFLQTFHSQRAVAALRQQVAPTATVLRDGVWGELARRAVVPGDIIRLGPGDLVPADAKLLEAVDLHMQEASLTGESLPAQKDARATSADGANQADALDRVFLGTSVVSGIGIARITATGSATTFGAIATHLATRPVETAFERGIRQFGFLIMRTVVFLVLFVFLIGVAFKHNPFESLLFAMALAVGLTPEFLPMITTITLGQGAIHMAKLGVIVKHLPAMQNFGSIDVLCSDKTGTLTSGVLDYAGGRDALGAVSDRPLRAGYLNSAFQTGLKSPLDSAILAQPAPDDLAAYHKIAEIPFDFERRMLSVIIADAAGARIITKGAPESVLPRCQTWESAAGQQPLDDAARQRSAATFADLSGQGYRVLAVATRAIATAERYTPTAEQDLVFVGYLVFADPPLPDVGRTISALRDDGVAVKIITGDNAQVARHVCGQVGIAVDEILEGTDLDRLDDAALAQRVEHVAVFARVSPAQKNRIILALRHRQHVVGYLGDGINDAPSLHTADVGISVASAADVARDAADIILTQRDLRALQTGILEGRKAFGNVMKYLLMGTSSNFGNMFSMAAAFVFLPFLPMLPTQILLNNFLYDLSQVTIPTDNVDETYMRQPRHWDIRLIRNFMICIGPISSIYDFLTFGMMLAIFHAPAGLFQTGWFVESLATQTLVLFVIRTAGNPFRSRPSRALTVTILAVVAGGALLPYTPLAALLGFHPLPAIYWLFLTVMVVTYLALVQVVKVRLMARWAA